jgi:hypothetical protein
MGGPGFEPGTSPNSQRTDTTTRLGGGYCLDCTSVHFELYEDMRGAPLYGAPCISYP